MSVMSLSKDEIEKIIRESVEAGTANGVETGVKRVLQTYGFDVDNPLEMQADFAHARYVRKGCYTIRKTVVIGVIGSVITALTAGVFMLLEEAKYMWVAIRNIGS
jgi:hypothetical protein